MRRDYADELRRRLTDVSTVISKLGLERGSIRQVGGGRMVRCPWHNERNASCSVKIGQDRTIRVHCFVCNETWDVISLIAQVYKLDVRRDFQVVLRRAAELANAYDIIDELEKREGWSGQSRRAPSFPSPPVTLPPPEPERTYPPAEEVADLWHRCVPTSEHLAASVWIDSRNVDPYEVDACNFARAIPFGLELPAWARYRGQSWWETRHHVLFPVVDELGHMRSVRASRVVSDGSDIPKRLPPAGHAASGLVLADNVALQMLELGAAPEWWPSRSEMRVVIVEGEPDFLSWAMRARDACETPDAVIGVVSGAWSSQIADRIPDRARVMIRTDHDRAGERYALEIGKTLSHRCQLMRSVEAAA